MQKRPAALNMVAEIPSTGEPWVGGKEEPISSGERERSPCNEGFVPFVPQTAVKSGIMISDEDLLEEAAAIKASIHSPRIVQARRRKATSGNGEPSTNAREKDHQLVKKLKNIMKCTAYSGKSAKANSSRDDGGFTSVFKGVTRHKATGRFEAHFWDSTYERPQTNNAPGGRKKPRRKGRQIYLGGFQTEVQAAKAYDMASIAFLGDKAQLNYERGMYADFEKSNVGKTTEVIVQEIKEISLASRAAKKRARTDPSGSVRSNAPTKRVTERQSARAASKKRNDASQEAVEIASKGAKPGFESPPFLPYSESKIRRRSGSMASMNELLLAHGGTATNKSGHAHAQQRRTQPSGLPNPSIGAQGATPVQYDTDIRFKSPHEQLGFNSIPRAGMSPSPIPISTALKQHFNSLPNMQTPTSAGPFFSYNAQDITNCALEKVPSHATVTFDASGSISGNINSMVKGWVEKSADQNFDVMQLSPMTKSIQLSPDFAYRGISMSPARSGLNMLMVDLNDTEIDIATFLNTEQQGTTKSLGSPDRSRMMQLPNPSR